MMTERLTLQQKLRNNNDLSSFDQVNLNNTTSNNAGLRGGDNSLMRDCSIIRNGGAQFGAGRLGEESSC